MSDILKKTSQTIALLVSATTSDEAEAVLKQILASLGYDATLIEGPAPSEKKPEGGLCVNPLAAKSWSILMRRGGRPAGSEYETELLARMACEVFGVVVTGIDAALRLEILSESLRGAISTMHHDIRTPLTSIAGMAQTLRMRPSVGQDVQEEFLERMEVSAETITAMTDEFRASLDAILSIAALPSESVRLDEVFGTAVDELRSRGIEVTPIIEPEAPLVVRAPSGVVTEVVSGVTAHVSSVLTGKAVAAIREESVERPAETAGKRMARMLFGGAVTGSYSIPTDLSKTWVPEGAMLSDEQGERLSRPYHLTRALGGSLEVSEEAGEVIFEISLPLSDRDRRPPPAFSVPESADGDTS